MIVCAGCAGCADVRWGMTCRFGAFAGARGGIALMGTRMGGGGKIEGCGVIWRLR